MNEIGDAYYIILPYELLSTITVHNTHLKF